MAKKKKKKKKKKKTHWLRIQYKLVHVLAITGRRLLGLLPFISHRHTQKNNNDIIRTIGPSDQ